MTCCTHERKTCFGAKRCFVTQMKAFMFLYDMLNTPVGIHNGGW
jgi:hypothetical protein